MGRLGLTLVMILMAVYTLVLSLDLLMYWTNLYAGLPGVVSVVLSVFGFVPLAGLGFLAYRYAKSGGYRVPVTLK